MNKRLLEINSKLEKLANRSISWEKIKFKAQQELWSILSNPVQYNGEQAIGMLKKMLGDSFNRNPKELREEQKNELMEKIKNWDIRNWNQLKEIVPKAFPNWINNSSIEFTDDGYIFTQNINKQWI